MAILHTCVYRILLSKYYVSYRIYLLYKDVNLEAQWLSDRVLDSRPNGLGFEPHRPHYVVVLE